MGVRRNLKAELLAWGHRGKAIIFDDHDKAVCFPPGWQVDEGFNYHVLSLRRHRQQGGLPTFM